MQRLKEAPTLLYETDNIFLTYALSVNTNTFTEIYKVWRSVKSHFVAIGLKQCGNGV